MWQTSLLRSPVGGAGPQTTPWTPGWWRWLLFSHEDIWYFLLSIRLYPCWRAENVTSAQSMFFSHIPGQEIPLACEWCMRWTVPVPLPFCSGVDHELFPISFSPTVHHGTKALTLTLCNALLLCATASQQGLYNKAAAYDKGCYFVDCAELEVKDTINNSLTF